MIPALLTATLLLAPPLSTIEDSPGSAQSPADQQPDKTLTVRVISALGEEGDAEVRQIVSERVESRAAELGITITDSPRLLLVRVGWSAKGQTTYEVQLSLATDASPPHRIETFDCSCSAPELLDKLDGRLGVLLPPIFEPKEEAAEPEPAPEPPPPVIQPPVPEPTGPHTSRHNAGIAAVATGSGLFAGGGMMLAFALGVDSATTSDRARTGTVIAAGAVAGVGLVTAVVGAVVWRQEKGKRDGRVSRIAPLQVRF